MKIAFLDSGIGGMTVLEAFCSSSKPSRMSSERGSKANVSEIIYLADLAHLPYGNKSIAELKEILLSNLNWLNGKVDIVVLACNTSSSLLDESIKTLFPRLQIFGLIEALVDDLKETQSELQTIAVFSTEATHRSESYKKNIQSVLPNTEVFSIPCPKLVPIIEETISVGSKILYDLAKPAVEEYIAQLPCEPQGVIFGCTHYPLLKQCFSELLPKAFLIDPANSVIKKLQALSFSAKNSKLQAYSTAQPNSLAAKIVSLKGVFACVEYFANKVGHAQTTSRATVTQPI